VSSFPRHLAITVVMAGLAGFLGVWVGISRIDRNSASAPPPLRKAVDELTHRGLQGLTPEQKEKIGAIEERYARQRARLRVRIADADSELSDALSEEMSFGPAVGQSIEDLKASVGELQRQTVVYVLDLRAVLTPAQQELFDQKVVEALMTDPH
jgi:Spy/CpxP family protein refolding chaperone